jgi:peptide/nickel transport system substrate-binding protein
MRITVWACDDCYGRTLADSRYFVTLLNRLGYRAKLKIIPLRRLTIPFIRRHVQTVLALEGALFWAASTFINRGFRCDGGYWARMTGFCDRKIDSQIKQALALQISDPASANALWARIERQLIDNAPIVPILNPNAFDFVSKRAGNYQYNPGTGALREQLWVR